MIFLLPCWKEDLSFKFEPDTYSSREALPILHGAYSWVLLYRMFAYIKCLSIIDYLFYSKPEIQLKHKFCYVGLSYKTAYTSVIVLCKASFKSVLCLLCKFLWYLWCRCLMPFKISLHIKCSIENYGPQTLVALVLMRDCVIKRIGYSG